VTPFYEGIETGVRIVGAAVLLGGAAVCVGLLRATIRGIRKLMEKN